MEATTFEWNDVAFKVKEKKSKVKKSKEAKAEEGEKEEEEYKYILQHLSGKVQSGELCAIMGASGAGKSTFLDVLAMRKSSKNMSGEITIDNKKVTTKLMKHLSAYVMQDDSLWGNLTVWENIKYTADLVLDHKTMSKEQKEKRITEIIELMGLTRVKDSKIGNPLFRGISGGERRRASIASQLVTLPRILFLDEPTSGLDSAAAFYVITAIKKLAKLHNMLVLATIHQPSPETFALFDKLFLLAAGKTVYYGDRADCVAYFNSIGYPVPEYTNPADFVLNLTNVDFFEDKDAAKRQIESLVGAFEKQEGNKRGDEKKEGNEREEEKNEEKEKEEKNKENEKEEKKEESAIGFSNGFIYQTWTITKRSVLNNWRNPLMFWIRLVMYIAMALLVGSAWFNVELTQQFIYDRLSFLFFSVAFLGFMAVAGIPAFLEERFIFVREYTNGYYGVTSYVLSNTVVMLPFLFIISMIYAGIAYPMVGLRAGASAFFTFVLFLWLGLIVAESLTIFVAGLIPVFVAALAVTAFLNGVFMVVQGYFIPQDNIPGMWIWANVIDYQKYSFGGMVFNEFQGLNFDCQIIDGSCFCIIPRADNSTCVITSQDVLNYYSYEDVTLWFWALILIIMFLVFRIGFFLTLKLRRYKR